MLRLRARLDTRHGHGGFVRRAARLHRRTLPCDLGIAGGNRACGEVEALQGVREHAHLLVPPGAGARLRHDVCGRRARRSPPLGQPQWVQLAMHDGPQEGVAGDTGDVGEPCTHLEVHAFQRLVHVEDMGRPVRKQCGPRPRAIQFSERGCKSSLK